MKNKFTFLVCGLLLGATFLPLGQLFAQQWKLLEQASLGLRYELPREWYVGGVLDARACHCTSGTVNSSYKGSLNMVVFSSAEYEVDSLLRQPVWGYHYVDAPAVQTLATENYEFSQSVSRWREDSTLQVIRLHTMRGNKRLVVYFWGEAAEVERQASTIERIVRSVSPLQ